MRQSIAERKMMATIKSAIDVQLNAFGLKIRRLENDRNSQRGKIIRLENEVELLKEKLKDKGER